MDNKVFLLVLIATFLHAIWNGMVKNHPDKVVAVAAIVLGHIPLAIIGFVVFSLVLIIPEKYGMATRIFSAVIGFIYEGL